MSGLLAGRRLLVTGVLTEASLAYAVARRAQEEGATVVLTAPARTARLVGRVAARLPVLPGVVPLDVTVQEDLDGLAEAVRSHVDGLDGVLHAIGYAPASALGSGLLETPWEDVAVALQVSTWSLPALCRATRPLLGRGASVVALDFDASVAWPSYDWMGVAKAGLESATRYLARELGPDGIRVNCVAAGPLRTLAARSVPGFDDVEAVWSARAPLGWDVRDPSAVAAACVALFSDLFPATTGSVLHVDGGVHAIGA